MQIYTPPQQPKKKMTAPNSDAKLICAELAAIGRRLSELNRTLTARLNKRGCASDPSKSWVTRVADIAGATVCGINHEFEQERLVDTMMHRLRSHGDVSLEGLDKELIEEFKSRFYVCDSFCCRAPGGDDCARMFASRDLLARHVDEVAHTARCQVYSKAAVVDDDDETEVIEEGEEEAPPPTKRSKTD